MSYTGITELQWQMIEPMFPNPIKRSRGKPHTPWRAVMSSILYVLVTGSKWDSLPKSEVFASKSASHRWYKTWKANGFLNEVLGKLNELSGLASALKFPSTRVRTPKAVQETVAVAAV